MIMVGPGTGVAPFRGFMQERKLNNSKGKNWLFFGECHQYEHFYYQEEWTALINEGFLQLDTAFSRDQPEKIYVQHRLWEHRHQVWEWIDGGAVFYVCGDAANMAKDVDLTLKKIIHEIGGQNPVEYIKEMRHQHRYLRDIY